MSECAKCRKGVRGESGVRCQGVCGKVYHRTQACASADDYSLKALENCPLLRFMCDNCMMYIANVDEALREMIGIAEANNMNVIEQKTDIEKMLKNHSKEVKI
ncbi:PREDICTED: uncharacterized protein LOC108359646 [Rhagoletis zephyria]|uniref:uncharacterized protein LOC108359646 n=1 Tax=Rhagoletis zephyria TaxID=28612 RepID=UPI00081134F3|nr:PREDICTED: uncharacterized protein LOC108359646 [Rhagoletis zephyria]